MIATISSYPIVVGLTGGVAAGKSAVRQMFESLGVPCLDADSVARSIHQDPKHCATQEIARAFPNWMTDEGALMRGSLQGLFARNAAANRILIGILMPHVLAAMRNWTQQQNATYAIWESALLASEPIAVNQLLVVEAAEPIRRHRMRQRNPQWSEDDMTNLLRTQASLKLTPAQRGDVIRNDEGLTTLRQQVEKLHSKYQTLGNYTFWK